MSVSGKYEVGTVRGHAIDNAQVGSVRDTEGEVGVRFKFTRDVVVAVAADVRIVHSSDVDMASIDLQWGARIGEV